MQDWIQQVKPGHKLLPKSLWNNTERPHRQLHVPAEILDIKHETNCDTGYMFKVRLKGGEESWLSAGWFCKPNSKHPLKEDQVRIIIKLKI
jgi:hypothetical protein